MIVNASEKYSLRRVNVLLFYLIFGRWISVHT